MKTIFFFKLDIAFHIFEMIFDNRNTAWLYYIWWKYFEHETIIQKLSANNNHNVQSVYYIHLYLTIKLCIERVFLKVHFTKFKTKFVDYIINSHVKAKIQNLITSIDSQCIGWLEFLAVYVSTVNGQYYLLFLNLQK